MRRIILQSSRAAIRGVERDHHRRGAHSRYRNLEMGWLALPAGTRNTETLSLVIYSHLHRHSSCAKIRVWMSEPRRAPLAGRAFICGEYNSLYRSNGTLCWQVCRVPASSADDGRTVTTAGSTSAVHRRTRRERGAIIRRQ